MPTATTFVDLADAQMLDYAADTDFSMLASGSSPAWLTVEATMSDESNPPAELEDYSETIEVDMEPHAEDEEMTEYEMADETVEALGQHGSNQDAELLDVEVNDPSRVVSPLPASRLATPATPQHTLVAQSPLSTFNTSEPLAIATEATDEHFIAVGVEEHEEVLLESSSDFQHVQAHSPLPFPTVGEDVQTESSTANEAPLDAEAVQGVLAPEEELASGGSPHDALQAPADTAVVASEPVTNGDSAGHNIAEASSVSYDEAAAQHEDAAYQENGIHEATDETQFAEHTSNGEDPHEISDGVYIDPPPAVLLSLLTPTGQQEVSLFNQPHTPSRSQSPNGYASTSASTDLMLLLHQRPTLYYEPLSNVFDALREEETIYNIPEFIDGELVLDAYDLDLKVAEDNTYAREVTIHDLNIIHDGIDLRGPLRLRLSASSPRFITRYHALRDQISQLTLGLGGEDSLYVEGEIHQGNEETGEYEKAHDEEAGEIAVPHEEPDSQEHGEESYDLQQTETELEEHDPESAHNAETFNETEEQAQVLSSAPDNDETSGFEHEAGDLGEDVERTEEISHVEYSTDLAAEAPADGLDVDEVHHFADAEEGGDYTEPAENVADDDNQFGEDLPEELGGAATTSEENHGIIDLQEDDNVAAQADLDELPDFEREAVGGNEESETTYDEFRDSPSLPPRDLDKGGEVLDNTSREDHTSLQIPADNGTNAGSAEVEQLQDYDELDASEAVDHPEDLDDAEWDDFEDDEDQVKVSADVYDDDSLSKYSSETLSSTRSKRSRDDANDENATPYGSPPETPELKRARVQ